MQRATPAANPAPTGSATCPAAPSPVARERSFVRRSAATHLPPSLSPRKRAERGKLGPSPPSRGERDGTRRDSDGEGGEGLARPSERFLYAMTTLPASVSDTLALLGTADYIADRSLATAVHLALHLKRPLFLEGEAGGGKTEIAKVLASALKRRLIRLQCYRGLDVASAVYEWGFARQMVEIRLAEAGEQGRSEIAS